MDSVENNQHRGKKDTREYRFNMSFKSDLNFKTRHLVPSLAFPLGTFYDLNYTTANLSKCRVANNWQSAIDRGICGRFLLSISALTIHVRVWWSRLTPYVIIHEGTDITSTHTKLMAFEFRARAIDILRRYPDTRSCKIRARSPSVTRDPHHATF